MRDSKGVVHVADIEHAHWEFDSECPKCGSLNHVTAPIGENIVIVHCSHCTHGYEYTHVISEFQVVPDSEE